MKTAWHRKPPLCPRLTGWRGGLMVSQVTGEPTCRRAIAARRLRVPRGGAADPLNLIQVMLAKGTQPPAAPPRPNTGKQKSKAIL